MPHDLPHRLLWVLPLVLVAFGCSAKRDAEVDFNRDVRPILNQRCVSCHGGVRRKGGLSLLFRSDALDTTESGKRAVVPGDPGGSELIRRVTSDDPDERMPLEDAPLSDEEIDLLRRWIGGGAPWADHWAYVPPEAPALPDVSDPTWPAGGLDHFILARLDAVGLTPSREAACPTLLRRVSLDLIGLPPEPSVVAASCTAEGPVDYEAFVDSLLGSPQFGERWAAMWLDLARYADSQGYEKDNFRSIWKYRDWVIDAFNRDLPFDRFTVEQLAGDLLPDPTEDQLVATAFHRNTMTNDEGGTDDEEFRVAAVVDRVNTTWEVWMGTTFACVQCHGHPYDPFRQADYYRFFAFFNNTRDVDRTDEYPTLHHFPEPTATRGRTLEAVLARIDARIDSLAGTPELVQARRAWERRLRDTIAVAGVPPTFEGVVLPHDILRILDVDEPERDGFERTRMRRWYAGRAPELKALRAERSERARALRELSPVTTPVLLELPPDERRTTLVFERGNYLVEGDSVAAGVPAALPPLPDGAPPNRLGAAEWIVSPGNPLTARVIVNRFWEQLFGIGIVETLEDFGTQGLPPSHPELLDWLALRFVHDHAWSVKALLRELVTSSTYRQSSHVTPDRLRLDPRNRLLARGPRVRLTAEQLRDQALAVSGLLSDKMHGPSVMPLQPPGIWRSPYQGARWVVSEGEDAHRRALYTHWRRTSPYPAFITFDSPSREFCVSRRIRTNTPLQALVLLNDPVFVEAAEALGRRMMAAGSSTPEARLETGYRLALQRPPSPEKLAELVTLYEDARAHYADHPDGTAALVGLSDPDPDRAALTVAANVILNLDEFVTKE